MVLANAAAILASMILKSSETISYGKTTSMNDALEYLIHVGKFCNVQQVGSICSDLTLHRSSVPISHRDTMKRCLINKFTLTSVLLFL